MEDFYCPNCDEPLNLDDVDFESLNNAYEAASIIKKLLKIGNTAPDIDHGTISKKDALILLRRIKDELQVK